MHRRVINNFVSPVIRFFRRFAWNSPQPRNNRYQLVEVESGLSINSNTTSSTSETSSDTTSAQKIIASYAAFVFAKENHQRIIAASLLTLLGTGLNFLAPYLLGEVINALSKEEKLSAENFDESHLWKIGGLVVVYTFSQIVPNIRDQVLIPVAAHNTEKLLTRITEHQLTKSLNYHINTPQSKQIYLIQKGFSVASMGTPLLTQVAPTLLELVIASAVLSQYGASIGLSASAMLALYTAYCVKTTPPIINARENMLGAGSKAWEAITNAISQYKTIHDFNKFPQTMKTVQAAVNDAAHAEINATSIPLQIGLGQIVIPRLAMLFAMLYFGKGIQSKQFSVSEFVALFGYLNQLSTMVPAVGQAMSQVFSSFPDLKFVFSELEKPSEIIDSHPEIKLKIDGPAHIEFRDVLFSYPGKSPTFINLTFTIEPGQTVALVSESGGGKSTLFNLLYGYYTPTSGAIYINGQNIAEISRTSLQENIGLVGQNPNLFNGTIRDNIQYGAKNSDSVDDKKIFDLAKDLNLLEFINSLPKQLDTDVGENGKAFSGGQQQKVAILRGFLKETPIRLLDEISAALDAGSATAVLEGIKKMRAHQSTTIMITHKLAEIISVDKIMVLDKGKVLAQGTHEELLANCPLYQNLWAKQNQDKAEAKTSSHSTATLLTQSLTSAGLIKETKKSKDEQPSNAPVTHLSGHKKHL